MVLLTAEDSDDKTVKPRLEAAGADRSRVEILKMIEDVDPRDGKPRDRMFSLVSDLGQLRQKVTEIGDVKAILIDPISAYLGVGKIDSYRTTDIRAVLSPLKDLAEELKVAVIGVLHFNKKVDVTNVLLRVSDSLAFVAAPRHVFGVIDDRENGRKLVVAAKNNLADAKQKQKSLAFRFGVKRVGDDPNDGTPIEAPHIVFDDGYVDVSATEALSALNENKSPVQRETARNFLLDILNDGPVPSVEIKEAAEANGIHWRTIERVKQSLRIVAERRSNKWFWRLPQEGEESTEARNETD